MLKPLCEKLLGKQIFTQSKVPPPRLLIHYKEGKGPLCWKVQEDMTLANWSNSASPIQGQNDITWLLVGCSETYVRPPLLAKNARKQSDICRLWDSLHDNWPGLGRKCQCNGSQKKKKSEIILISRRWKGQGIWKVRGNTWSLTGSWIKTRREEGHFENNWGNLKMDWMLDDVSEY